MLNTPEIAVTYYKRVLALDASNVESVACLAANHFYSDQPEISLRYYRRLLQVSSRERVHLRAHPSIPDANGPRRHRQMGVNNTEMWNNLGLCCFYSSQYDISLSCFERALELADDGNMADVW